VILLPVSATIELPVSLIASGFGHPDTISGSLEATMALPVRVTIALPVRANSHTRRLKGHLFREA